MFPEYRELISKLKTADMHFARLFDQHNTLDQRIKNIEEGIEVLTGVAAGREADGSFVPGRVFAQVNQRLTQMADELAKFSGGK